MCCGGGGEREEGAGMREVVECRFDKRVWSEFVGNL